MDSIKSEIKELRRIDGLEKLKKELCYVWQCIAESYIFDENKFNLMSEEFYINLKSMNEEEIKEVISYIEMMINNQEYNRAVEEKRVLVVKGLTDDFSFNDIAWALSFDRALFKVVCIIPIKNNYTYVILNNAYIVELLFKSTLCENEIINGKSMRKIESKGITQMLELTKHDDFKL